MKDGVNDDADEKNEDQDNDGHLVFPINPGVICIILSPAYLNTFSCPQLTCVRAASLWRPTTEP